MAQQDFLKRQTDQLGEALGKMIAMLPGLSDQSGSHNIATIKQAFTDELAIDIEVFVAMPDEEFIIELIEKRKFSNHHLLQLASILEYVTHTDAVNEQRIRYYEQCICICEYLNSTGTYSLELEWKIKDIKNRLTKI